MRETLARELVEHGVLVSRDCPRLRGAIARALSRGELERVLPGVYVEAGGAADWRRRVVAATSRHPDAVVVGRAAAALSFWPDCRVDVVELARPTATATARGFSWRRSGVPQQWTVRRHGITFAHPAWTAVDLAVTLGGEVLDQALRAGIPLAQLRRARRDMAGHRGCAARERLLKDSRDSPWSEGERILHRMLRDAGITGWSANLPVAGCFVDVGWRALRTGVEVDGYAFHGNRQSFEDDRRREQRLLAQGWVLMHVTWRQCVDNPDEVLSNLTDLLRIRAHGCGVTAPLLGSWEMRVQASALCFCQEAQS